MPGPTWVPVSAQWYLAHTVDQRPIRALARDSGRHPSTILRHVRRIEQRRDDPLIDSALLRLGRSLLSVDKCEDVSAMTAPMRPSKSPSDEATVTREAKRILRRLCETGAFLAIAPDLEKAVVLKEGAKGETTRIAVVSRGVAEAFALKDWISCHTRGRVTTYQITGAGRAALKRILAEEPRAVAGFAEAQTPFGAQHREWAERPVMGAGDEEPRQLRYNLAESPLALLARRKDKGGNPFLTSDLVSAGERLREDFELAQMGPRVTQNWDRFLSGGDRGGFGGAGGPADGPRAARDRVAAALRDLGPGLGDVVLRCCCFLEGMEAAEKRMGWSARSGKIVLRIALQRLRRHYDEQSGGRANMIG
ncbi:MULTISPECIES: DUF6456 domain-containing protein [Actibacterium]|uniref:DUF6456 domain-containing protein n=1 Tax=Actibacterium naphthalenivorans TaxID=1614693 RepID=A0A840CG82_9RHOB|nr:MULTISPECIES: DUF6456 domain-containing protein [Actibacterium]ALG91899.1 hypothetical protein TQ29_09340 [Actibacterium sp. EMB200-NS6]MBB4022289.1 hypothetical protein [Actibacterium naphthalenivorans]